MEIETYFDLRSCLPKRFPAIAVGLLGFEQKSPSLPQFFAWGTYVTVRSLALDIEREGNTGLFQYQDLICGLVPDGKNDVVSLDHLFQPLFLDTGWVEVIWHVNGIMLQSVWYMSRCGLLTRSHIQWVMSLNSFCSTLLKESWQTRAKFPALAAACTACLELFQRP